MTKVKTFVYHQGQKSGIGKVNICCFLHDMVTLMWSSNILTPLILENVVRQQFAYTRRTQYDTKRDSPLIVIIKIVLSRFTSLLHFSKFSHKIVIHFIPKWRQINYSFVYMLISLLCLIFTSKFSCFLYMMTRQRGLVNMQTKEYFLGCHFGIRRMLQ